MNDVHPPRAGHDGHGAHQGHGPGVLVVRPRVLGYSPPAIPGARWIAPIFGTMVFLYGGLPFVQGAIHELRDRLPGMMTLIALAITVAFGFSAAVTLGYPGTPLWEELATLVTIMLLGHWLEMRSITQARGALA